MGLEGLERVWLLARPQLCHLSLKVIPPLTQTIAQCLKWFSQAALCSETFGTPVASSLRATLSTLMKLGQFNPLENFEFMLNPAGA